MAKLNLAELDRLERIIRTKQIAMAPIFPGDVVAALAQLRPLLDLVDRLGVAGRELADHVHYDFDANCVVADRMIVVLKDYQRAKEHTTECEKCTGTGARHVASEPVISEACGECSGEGVV